MATQDVQYLVYFRMPQSVKITGRSSSITKSFINAIIPVVPPTNEEVKQALAIPGMLEGVTCAYGGDTYTEWDHLRPLVVNKHQPATSRRSTTWFPPAESAIRARETGIGASGCSAPRFCLRRVVGFLV